MKHILRKHGKIIMTVMGVVLMITFSLPTFRGGSGSGSVMVGRLNGQKVYNLDIQSAYQELGLLQRLGFLQRMLIPNVVTPESPDSSVHWYLLVHEATQRGFVANPETVKAQVEAISKDFPDIIDSVGTRGLSDAIGHWLMVDQLLDSVAGGKATSLPQIEYAADWAFSQVDISYATLDANTGWDKEPTPGDAQIQAQYDLYKDVVRPSAVLPDSPDATPPLVAAHRYPFGYKYPNRVHVEYLVFDRAALRAKFHLTQEDYDRAEAYWRANPTDPDIAIQPPPGVPTTSAPAIKPFEQVKDLLANRELDKRVNREMDQIIAQVQAPDPWQQGATEDQQVPRSQWPDFQKLRDDIAKSFNGYTPAYHNSLEFKTDKGLLGPGDLSRLPGIGDAYYRIGNPPADFYFATLASNVRELVKLSTKDQLGRIQGMQVGAEGPPLRDKSDNIYIYRVLDVQTSRPAQLAEVRDQVIEDLKKLALYRQKQTEADALATAARIAAPGTGQLAALAAKRNPAPPVSTATALSRWENNLPAAVATVKGFLEAAFSTVTPDVVRQAADALRQPMSAQAAAQPVYVAPRTPHVATLDDDAGLKIYVIALDRYAAPSPAKLQALRQADLPSEYQNLLSTAQYYMQRGDPDDATKLAAAAAHLEPLMVQTGDWGLRTFAQRWFSLKAVVERMHYIPAAGYALSTSSGPEGS